MTSRNLSLKLEIAMDDGLKWKHHNISWLRILALDSGPMTVIGTDPKLRRGVLGVFIKSKGNNNFEYSSTLRSNRRAPVRMDSRYDTLAPIKAWRILASDRYLGDVDDYEFTIATSLRRQVLNELRNTLESSGVRGISDDHLKQWITISTEQMLETGETRMVATSRPITKAMVMSVNRR